MKTSLTLNYEEWEMYQSIIEMALKAINDRLYEYKEKKKKDYRLKLIGYTLVEVNIKLKKKMLTASPRFTMSFTAPQSLALLNAYLEEYIMEYDMYTTSLLKAKIIPILDKAVA